MRCYAITEGLGADRALVFVERNLRRGVEMVQIREKQLGAAELERLVRRVMEMRGDLPIKILVNGTVSYGADGVHLPGGAGLRPAHAGGQVRDLPHVVGLSCHTVEEVRDAAADFVVFGPVFSKTAVGIEALRAACVFPIPVFALGGVTWENAAECIPAGAAGIAGIRLFRP